MTDAACSSLRRALGLFGLAVVGVGLMACSKATTVVPSTSAPSEPTTAAGAGTTSTGGSAASDITVTSCKQDSNDTTQVDVAGTIVNHLSATSDYSFVVDIFNGSSPAGQVGVTKNSVVPALVESWSASSTIPGSTTGSFHCRVRSVLRTPLHS